MKILIGAARRGRLDRYQKEIAAAVAGTKLHEATFAYEFNDSDEDYGSDIGDCDVLLIPTSRGIRGEAIERAKKLRLVQKLGATSRIDLAACKRRNIAVSVIAHRGHVAVAEHTIMMMLASARHLVSTHAAVVRGDNPAGLDPIRTSKSVRHANWLDLARDSFAVLSGQTLGLVGFGDIAQEVAKRARAFGLRTLYTKRTRLDAAVEEALGVTYADLPALLASSDYVSLHATQGENDPPLIGRDALALMKPGAVLVNTARGNQVDQAALIEALRAGRLGGACLDVFATEPALPGEFEGVPNVVLTPHTAGVVPWNALYGEALRNIERFFQSGTVAGLL